MESAEEFTIEHIKVEVRQVQSILRMLEGNTTPEDIKKFGHAWVDPIMERLNDAQRRTGQKEHENQYYPRSASDSC